MKVAIYVHDMRASGVVRAMIALARSLAHAGDDAVLVAGIGAGHFTAADVAPARLVAATDRPAARLPRLRVVPALRRTLRDLAPDVIVSGGNHGHVSLWAATRGLRVPLVFTFSNPIERPGQPLRTRWRRVKGRILVAASARSIVVGRNVADSPAFANPRVVLIRNGIDLAAARAATGAVPAAMTGPDPVVLAIGRLHPQKNIEALIDAVAVASATRALRLVILGGGTDASRAALTARAAARGIAARVTFAGVTDDVPAWLRAARVFALASRWEGGPSLVLLEAMAAGTPVVANATGSDAPDVLDHGRYGVLADANDPAAFAAALLAQIDDPVRPGNRADAYCARRMHAAYRDLLLDVAHAGERAAPEQRQRDGARAERRPCPADDAERRQQRGQ